MGESWCEWGVSRILRAFFGSKKNPKLSHPCFGNVLWVLGCLCCTGCDLYLGVALGAEHPWSGVAGFFSLPFSLRLSLSFFLASQMHLVDSKCQEVDFGGLLGIGS